MKSDVFKRSRKSLKFLELINISLVIFYFFFTVPFVVIFVVVAVNFDVMSYYNITKGSIFLCRSFR